MVQFELKLEQNVVEKWRQHYLDYKRLKKCLKGHNIKASKKTKIQAEQSSEKSRSGGYDVNAKEDTNLLSRRSEGSLNQLGGKKGGSQPWLELASYGSGYRAMAFEEARVKNFIDAHGLGGTEHEPATRFERELLAEITKFCEFYESQLLLHREQLNFFQGEMISGANGASIRETLKEPPSEHLPTAVPNRAASSPKLRRATEKGTTPSLSDVPPSASALSPPTMPKIRPPTPDRAKHRRNRHSQHEAVSFLYREMLELKNFAGLNYTAVIKIVKKAAKTAQQNPFASPLVASQLSNQQEFPKGLLSQCESSGSVELSECKSGFDQYDRLELNRDSEIRVKHKESYAAIVDKSVDGKENVALVKEKQPGNRNLVELAHMWMSKYDFRQGHEAQEHLRQLEQLYARMFCDGDVKLALGELEANTHRKEDAISFELLKLGYRLGMGATLGIWVIWDCMLQGMKKTQASIDSTPGFPAFCALAGLLALHWSWGIQVWVWTRFRINYIYVFELDPRHVRSYIKIFNDCTVDTLWFLSLMLLYFKATLNHFPFGYFHAPPGIFLVIAFTYTAWRFVFPWQERKGIWRAFYAVVMPWSVPSITFFHTYVGDVMTSMIKIFLNLLFTVFFLCVGDVWLPAKSWGYKPIFGELFFYRSILSPLVVFLPLWWRFVQCLLRYHETGKRWPHMYNGCKYGASMTVTVFGALHPLYTTVDEQLGFKLFWLTLFVVSTLFSAYWDIYQDWGLGKPEYGYLNDRQMYPKKWYYFASSFVDLALRFLWIYSLIPPQPDIGKGSLTSLELFLHWLAPVSMLLEMVRRTIWGIFRLENEQLRNTEGYRKVKFVPLHFDRTPETLQTEGKNVVLEVAAFGAAVVIFGSIALLAVRQTNENGIVINADDDGNGDDEWH